MLWFHITLPIHSIFVPKGWIIRNENDVVGIGYYDQILNLLGLGSKRSVYLVFVSLIFKSKKLKNKWLSI